MTVTVLSAGLITLDAVLTGQVDKTALGSLLIVITLAGKQYFDQHANEKPETKPTPEG